MFRPPFAIEVGATVTTGANNYQISGVAVVFVVIDVVNIDSRRFSPAQWVAAFRSVTL